MGSEFKYASWRNITNDISIVDKENENQSDFDTGKLPVARYGHRVICVKDWLVLFGGGSPTDGTNGEINSKLYAFNTTTSQWLELEATPDSPKSSPPGAAASAVCSDGSRLFCFGGLTEDSRFTKFFLKIKLWSIFLKF